MPSLSRGGGLGVRREGMTTKIPPARVTIPEGDRAAILADFDKVLSSGRLTLGPFTEVLEREYAKLVGKKYAVAVNSGTSALEIIFRTIGVAGKTVVVPTNTFFATPAAVLHAGGRVMFADISDHLMLDVDSFEEREDNDIAAVVVVHIGGYVHPEIARLRELCDHRQLPLIEDAAHAQGSTLGGHVAGAFGLASAFSFYPTKVMTTGEGGMITTDEEELARKARVFRDQGKADFGANYHVELGYNWRMGELNAVLGIHQLRRLPEFLSIRRRMARIYRDGLETVPATTQLVAPSSSDPNFYKFVCFLRRGLSKAELKVALRSDYDISLS